MKNKAPLLLIPCLLVALFLASCQRTCICYGYDGLEHRYSEEQVDANGGNCQNMIIQANTRFYSVCNWE